MVKKMKSIDTKTFEKLILDFNWRMWYQKFCR